MISNSNLDSSITDILSAWIPEAVEHSLAEDSDSEDSRAEDSFAEDSWAEESLEEERNDEKRGETLLSLAFSVTDTK